MRAPSLLSFGELRHESTWPRWSAKLPAVVQNYRPIDRSKRYDPPGQERLMGFNVGNSILSIQSKALPITQGRLLDFPDDPFACMRRLYQAHGEIAALEEGGHRLIFVFG